MSQLPRIIYISFTKRSIWGPLVPYGSDGRSARSFPNASTPLQILYKTEHSGASGASWLWRPIRQILSKCFKSFRNPLQSGALWSLWRLMAQEADPPDHFKMLQILCKAVHSGALGAAWLKRQFAGWLAGWLPGWLAGWLAGGSG